MTQTVLILLAATANVILNLCLKALGQALHLGAGPWRLVGSAVMSPWFWLAGISGLALIGLFMAAIRQGSVAVTYIGVTALAMIGLTLAAALLHGDVPSLTRMAGLGLVLAGLALTLAG